MINPETGALLPETRQALTRRYVEALAEAARAFQFKLSDLDYSEAELAYALDEADIDLGALLERRSREDGLSDGKIAGVIAYRLSRFKIVHFIPAIHDKRDLYMVQDAAALYLVQSLILRCKLGNRRFLELAYQMSRRHANQETLALCFDTFLAVFGAGPKKVQFT
jgi:hypothetical protein